MRTQLAATGLAAALVLVPTSAAMADDVSAAAPAAVTAAVATDDDGDEGLWGLAGLLGLIGLAGLKRRNDPYDHNTGTTARDGR